MKTTFSGRFLRLAACLLLCLAGLWVTAAADYSQAGDILTLYDLSPATDTVIAAGYDSQGRMLFAETVKASNGEGTVTLPSSTAASIKAFFLSSSWAPVAEPQLIEQGPPTRLWMCQIICDFLEIDLDLYAGRTIRFDDCQDLTDAEKAAVLAVTDSAILNGMGNNLFAPDKTVNRAEAVTILWRMLWCPEAPAGSSIPYSDVPSDKWYADAVRYFYGIGLLPANARFLPDVPATRQDVLAWTNGLMSIRGQLPSCEVSNLRFELQNGLPVLAWDCDTSVQVWFEVYAYNGSDWRHIADTDDLSMLLIGIGGSDWNGIGVAAVDLQTGEELAWSNEPSLSVHINYLSPSGPTPALSITNMGSYHRITVDNLNGYDTCSVDYGQNDSGYNYWGTFTRLNGRNTWTFETDAPSSYLPPIGYCRIEAGRNYILSANGNSLSYDSYLLRDWSQAIP